MSEECPRCGLPRYAHSGATVCVKNDCYWLKKTAEEKFRDVRRSALHHFPLTLFLSERVCQDFIDGKCQLRVYQNTPIVDYTKRWGEA